MHHIQSTNELLNKTLLAFFGKSMLTCWIHIDGCFLYYFLVLSSRYLCKKVKYNTFTQQTDYWTKYVWLLLENMCLCTWSIKMMCVKWCFFGFFVMSHWKKVWYIIINQQTNYCTKHCLLVLGNLSLYAVSILMGEWVMFFGLSSIYHQHKVKYITFGQQTEYCTNYCLLFLRNPMVICCIESDTSVR